MNAGRYIYFIESETDVWMANNHTEKLTKVNWLPTFYRKLKADFILFLYFVQLLGVEIPAVSKLTINE